MWRTCSIPTTVHNMQHNNTARVAAYTTRTPDDRTRMRRVAAANDEGKSGREGRKIARESWRAGSRGETTSGMNLVALASSHYHETRQSPKPYQSKQRPSRQQGRMNRAEGATDGEEVKGGETNNEAPDPREVLVDPGGETEARRNGNVAHGDANAEVDREVEGESSGTCRDISIKRESWSATAHVRSTTALDEDDQHTSTGDNDVPGIPPAPPEPPDEPAQRENEPPSVELEGEWNLDASFEDGPSRAETDASGVSGHTRRRPQHPRMHQRRCERWRRRYERAEWSYRLRRGPRAARGVKRRRGRLGRPNSFRRWRTR